MVLNDYALPKGVEERSSWRISVGGPVGIALELFEALMPDNTAARY
jgi:hypothetical protein